MTRALLFNKPYGVLCQFRPVAARQTLRNFIHQPGVYPAGRLDADSEGLVLLTDDGLLQHRISAPEHKLVKTYFVQVEGTPDPAALQRLARGVDLRDFVTRPAHVEAIDEPAWLWPRHPPVRFRKNIPTTWLKVAIREGKNRQIRRMTAAVGFPTLRLLRHAIGDWTLDDLPPGHWREAAVPREMAAPRRVQPVRK